MDLVPGSSVSEWVGSGSAAYGQGWDMDAIAACVVGGVSFTGGIGKNFRSCNWCINLYISDILSDNSWY